MDVVLNFRLSESSVFMARLVVFESGLGFLSELEFTFAGLGLRVLASNPLTSPLPRSIEAD